MQANCRSREFRRRNWPFASAAASCCAAFFAFATVLSPAASHAQTEWLTDRNRIDQNLSPVSVTWSGSPIREQLTALAQQRKMAIYLDPAVDPSLKQTLSFRNRTTDQIVWETAEANSLGAARIGDLLYVGPKSIATQLPHTVGALNKRIARAKFDNRKAWLRSYPTRWENGTNTEDILAAFAAQGTPINDPDGLVPFDVLAAADWPPLKAPERACVFLAAWNLSIEIRDGKPTVCPLPKLDSARVIVNLPEGTSIPKQFDGLWKKGRRGKITLEGPVERLAEFTAWQIGNQKTSIPDDQIKTFSINVTERRGAILKALADQTNREFVFEQDCVESLNERITVSAKELPFADIIAQCSTGAGLKIAISETEVRITRIR